MLYSKKPALLRLKCNPSRKNICAECRRNQEKYGYNLNMDIIWYDDIRGLPFFVAVAGPGHIWCLDLNLGLGWVWGPPGVFSGGSLGLAFAPPWGCWFYGGSCMLAVFLGDDPSDFLGVSEKLAFSVGQRGGIFKETPHDLWLVGFPHVIIRCN